MGNKKPELCESCAEREAKDKKIAELIGKKDKKFEEYEEVKEELEELLPKKAKTYGDPIVELG